MKIRTFAAGSFSENTYLVSGGEGSRALAVDPGAGAPGLVEVVEAEGLDVRAILLTHAHLDHLEGIPRVRTVCDAPIFLHPKSRPLYDIAPEQARTFGVDIPDLPEPERALSHGELLEIGPWSFRVRHVPGHEPGHVLFWEEEERLAFVGDVVFRGSIGRTDLPGGDFRTLMTSIREQVLTLPGSTRLLPGHGPETTVEDERSGNPFLIPHYGGELA